MPVFGNQSRFYDLLDRQAELAWKTAQTFHALTKDFSRVALLVGDIEQLERKADEVTHDLANLIDSTFVTPLDKEDLHRLGSGLDDITDAIEAAAARVALYRITEVRSDLEPMAAKLIEATEATRTALSGLRNLRQRHALQEAINRVHAIESEGDSLFRSALEQLFNAPNPDPMNVIKWKEIYDRVEVAMDKCEDIAIAVESVVVKYA